MSDWEWLEKIERNADSAVATFSGLGQDIKRLLYAVKVMKEALEYYEDKDGGPYAPGDHHSVDGGEKAYRALEQAAKGDK